MVVKSSYKWCISLLMVLVIKLLGAQEVFQSPLKIPQVITAGFGEIRNNHFHSGIDLSTQGINQEVLAAASGYLRRVKVSLGGYGNAIYMDHPQGFTTVYAHLSEFHPSIEDFILKKQYELQSYEIDVEVDSALIKFSKGDKLGMSGNTGSSTAPHLHFEIRDKYTEEAMNPLTFGFGNDKVAPKPTSLLIIPKENYGTVNLAGRLLRIPLIHDPKLGMRPPSNLSTPKLTGWVGFGFEGGDIIGKPGNYSGIYNIQVLVDGEEIFNAKFDKFGFNEFRSVNNWIDYEAKKRYNKKYQRCIVPPNPLIGIYKSHKNKGYYLFNENRQYKIEWIFTDAHKNTTTTHMNVQGGKPISWEEMDIPNHLKIVPPTSFSLKEGNSFVAEFSSRSLYDTARVIFKVKPQQSKYSSLVELGNSYIPLHEGVKLKFKPENYPASLKTKLCIAEKDKGKYDVLSSSWEGEWLVATARYFGDFEVIADTIPPDIDYLPRKVKSSKTGKYVSLSPADAGYIKIKVTDPVSDSFTWKGFIDGQWVLMKPGKGKNTWYINVNNTNYKGNHVFSVSAVDEYGNESSYELPFTIP